MTQEDEEVFELVKELKDSGLLDILMSALKNREGILLEIANWLQNNENVMKNLSTFLAALSKLNPDEMKKARSLTDVLNMVKDPDVLSGLSFFLNLMKVIGEVLRE
ncbi:DUF1641 domain-containing protein [Acidianus brierleyi]|uniref:DUF1641 domain-containing protein n=1 Tax=Acidianus brierleyi TaxID=41673 RepID=A0A2U9IHM6_9CREN|nr:DUF1641 domain-containing protein [Acidianus brierleyi]AWR95529.1 DUF1641 domain-containing protein [Acidianus brierleyi]